MKKSKWLDCQGNKFFPKQKGTPSLVKIEHKNTATLDSARSKKILSRSSATSKILKLSPMQKTFFVCVCVWKGGGGRGGGRGVAEKIRACLNGY